MPATPHLRWPNDRETEFIRYWAEELETYSCAQILQWAFDTYSPRVAVISSFGLGGCILASMLSENEIDIPLYHVDTGYHFLETHELGFELQNRYDIKIERFSPETTVEEYEAANGLVYQFNPERCCHDRKYEVLHQIAPELNAWICGIRRDQCRSRAGLPIIDWDERFGVVRIAPLARWSKQCIWEKVRRDRIPYHPLLDQGYSSVTCAPCTHSDFSDELELRF